MRNFQEALTTERLPVRAELHCSSPVLAAVVELAEDFMKVT